MTATRTLKMGRAAIAVRPGTATRRSGKAKAKDRTRAMCNVAGVIAQPTKVEMFRLHGERAPGSDQVRTPGLLTPDVQRT
jgi:hypothetical protein